MLGYVASVFIGISLGLIGGGGSILTVPVLVYLFNVDAVVATAYSLFIVGSTSAVGSMSYFRNGLVNVRAAIVFGIPSIIAVFLTRAILLPAIPEEIIRIGSFTLTKSIFLMLLFATLMLAASYSMIKKEKPVIHDSTVKKQLNYLVILFEGIIVGILTGLVGAGGGFLIIPALVILSNLPIKEAIGTSLIIISAKSLIGFLGEGHQTIIDWPMLMSITAFAIAGIFIGTAISKKVNGAALKPAFGWFVLVMGIYIMIKETFLN
jgi:hypothetical protein